MTEFVVIRCPRCGTRSCRIWRHLHHRLGCSGPPCPVYEAECDSCEYPAPKGMKPNVRYRAVDLPLDPIESLPSPYDQWTNNPPVMR